MIYKRMKITEGQSYKQRIWSDGWHLFFCCIFMGVIYGWGGVIIIFFIIYKSRQMRMNLQSPTTLLSSIQEMKNKLRNDKQLLLDIRCDFTKINKKNNPQPQVIKESKPSLQKSYFQSQKNSRQSHSIDQNHKNKIMQVKKQHQRELLKMQQKYQKQISQLSRIKDKQMQDMDSYYKQKIEQQNNYICLLEEEACSPIQSQRERVNKQQYEIVINQLLQDNNRMYQENANLKDQCEKWKKVCYELQSDRPQKNRFKFAKMKREESSSNITQSDRSNFIHQRSSSVLCYNKENVDTNLNQWQDGQILDEETSLKTIRQFQKSRNDSVRPDKRKGYLSLKI